jgi:hypothetical protein
VTQVKEPSKLQRHHFFCKPVKCAITTFYGFGAECLDLKWETGRREARRLWCCPTESLWVPKAKRELKM